MEHATPLATLVAIRYKLYQMKAQDKLSTRQAAAKLGVTILTLQRHIAAKTIKAPPLLIFGSSRVRLWTARDIEKARNVLAGIRPGRKKKQ